VAVAASARGRIGNRLRRARALRGVELEQVARDTRITPRYLEALERDAPPEAFPAPVYARLFLREYAQWLGLDPAPLVHSYVEAHPETDRPLVLPSPVQRPPGKWGRRLLTIASVAALVTLAVVSARTRGEPSEQRPAFPSPAPSGAPAAGPLEPERDAVPAAVVLRVDIVDGRCWVRVMADDQVVIQKTADPGFSRTFRAYRRLQLRLGNAGAARLTLNGKRLENPGSSGEIQELSFIRSGGGVRVESREPR
jgi:cytoskeleton protein RodZ